MSPLIKFSFLPTQIVRIDTSESGTRLRLVNGHGALAPYISYRWGTDDHKLVEAKKILYGWHILWERLPATLRDAATITARFGIRYTWIDALCIVQDDSIDWTKESSQMKDVYIYAA